LTTITHHKKPATKLRKALLLFLFLQAMLFASAQTPSAANQVKAVFLFNFTQFVSWPPSTFSSSNAPFVIGILGPDPFRFYLESVVENERVEGRPIVVQRFSEQKDVRNCQILFINKSNAADIAKDLNSTGMLTVSDAEDFAKDGGMIRFYLENSKIRLQINARAAKAANLTISSKLLRLADVLNSQP
jgi:hypothetical protein